MLSVCLSVGYVCIGTANIINQISIRSHIFEYIATDCNSSRPMQPYISICSHGYNPLSHYIDTECNLVPQIVNLFLLYHVWQFAVLVPGFLQKNVNLKWTVIDLFETCF